MGHFALCHQPTMLRQSAQNRPQAGAVFTLLVKNGQSGHQGHMIVKAAVFGNGLRNRDTVFLVCQYPVIKTMSWRDVNQPCSTFRRYIIAMEQWHGMIEAALFVLESVQWVSRNSACQITRVTQSCDRVNFGLSHDAVDQIVRNHKSITNRIQTSFGDSIDPIVSISNVAVKGHRSVGWDRPGGRGPNDCIRPDQLRVIGTFTDGELNPDRHAFMVMVLDLSVR